MRMPGGDEWRNILYDIKHPSHLKELFAPACSRFERRSFLASILGGTALLAATTKPVCASSAVVDAGTRSAGLGPLKRVRTSTRDIAYVEAGRSRGRPLLLLHGWSYDIHTYERGRQGYAAHAHDFAKLIWKSASPAGPSMNRPSHVQLSRWIIPIMSRLPSTSATRFCPRDHRRRQDGALTVGPTIALG